VFLGLEWKAFLALSPTLQSTPSISRKSYHPIERKHSQPFIAVEADPGGCHPVTLVVGDDFYPTTPLNTGHDCKKSGITFGLRHTHPTQE
jgi:hypothetical protein